MGEAKRKKEILGSDYGKLLGLTKRLRKDLITDNITKLIYEHIDNCGYDNYMCDFANSSLQQSALEKDFQLHFRGGNIDEIVMKLVEHWQSVFNDDYPLSALKSLVNAMCSEQPIILENSSPWSVSSLKPVVTLPEARKYFQLQAWNKKIYMSSHCTLLKEVFTVLATPDFIPLLKQLFMGEFYEVIYYAQVERLPWLTKNLRRNGWINLDDELLFNTFNIAIVGILTTLATLPWESELRKLQEKA